jgi:hypothetical protein
MAEINERIIMLEDGMKKMNALIEKLSGNIAVIDTALGGVEKVQREAIQQINERLEFATKNWVEAKAAAQYLKIKLQSEGGLVGEFLKYDQEQKALLENKRQRREDLAPSQESPPIDISPIYVKENGELSEFPDAQAEAMKI